MSARLGTAIRIADAAAAILRKTRSFTEPQVEGHEDRGHVGVEPMLLALAMELALKAWWIFDYDDVDVFKSHDLLRLFEGLKIESQRVLDHSFRQTVAKDHPNIFYSDFGIRDVLNQHRNALT